MAYFEHPAGVEPALTCLEGKRISALPRMHVPNGITPIGRFTSFSQGPLTSYGTGAALCVRPVGIEPTSPAFQTGANPSQLESQGDEPGREIPGSSR